MSAKGIVDADNRHDKDQLNAEGVSALGLYAVESIYYHPAVIEKLIENAGTDKTLSQITELACDSISDGDIDRLAKDASYKSFRQSYDRSRPNSVDYWANAGPVTITFDNPQSDLQVIADQVRSMKQYKNWLGIIEKVKIKSTPATNEIAKALGYAGQAAYEKAALKMLKAQPEVRESLRVALPDPFS